jgi:hypothetical protein
MRRHIDGAGFISHEREAKSQFRTTYNHCRVHGHVARHLDVVSRIDALAAFPGASPAGPSPARVGLGQLTITSIPEVTKL